MKRGLVLALALLGCDLAPRPTPCGDAGVCACAAPRRLPAGGCCPAWTVASPTGACAARSWTRPTLADGLGPAGARHVDVALDAAGRALAVWQIDSVEPHLVAAEEQPGGALALRDLAARVGAGLLGYAWPRAAAGPDGTAVLTWATVAPQELGVVYASLRDATGAWHNPQSSADALSFPTRAYQPRPATNAAGEWLVVWDQWNSTGYGVGLARRRRGEAAWTRPHDAEDVLSPHVFFSNAPTIALNDAGQALSAWYQSNGGPLMVYVSERATADGAFSRPGSDQFLSARGAPVDENPMENPVPIVAPSGEAAVVWTQEDGKTTSIPVYLATRDAAGRWTAPRDLADTFSAPTGIMHDARMVVGPRGDLYVVWASGVGKASTLYAARRAPDGRWLEDGRHPLALSAPGTSALLPALAVGPGGGVVVAWTETAGGHSRIVARRTGGAEEAWSQTIVLSPEGDDADEPAVVVGGSGDRAIVAWVQGPFGKRRAYLARTE